MIRLLLGRIDDRRLNFLKHTRTWESSQKARCSTSPSSTPWPRDHINLREIFECTVGSVEVTRAIFAQVFGMFPVNALLERLRVWTYRKLLSSDGNSPLMDTTFL